MAQQIKELSLPSTYISGTEKGNNSNLLQSLIGADLAKRMMTKEK